MKNKYKNKIAVVLLVVAMTFGVIAVPGVEAQSSSNATLLALISQLQAQITALIAQLSNMGRIPAYVFARNLTVGSRGPDVTALQNFLISRDFIIPAGPTGYFGSQTRSALAAFQVTNGISPASGFFGPITRARVNALFVPVPLPPKPPIIPPGTLQGGVGDIFVSERTAGIDGEVFDGQDDIKVLGFEIESKGSDIAVNSVRVEFEHAGSGSRDLDDYADEISIMRDNRVVGVADVDDFSENNGVFSRSISISREIIRENDADQFYVAVTAVNLIDGDDLSEGWKVGLSQIRFEDGTGATLTDNTGDGVDGPITQTFTFEDDDDFGN